MISVSTLLDRARDAINDLQHTLSQLGRHAVNYLPSGGSALFRQCITGSRRNTIFLRV